MSTITQREAADALSSLVFQDVAMVNIFSPIGSSEIELVSFEINPTVSYRDAEPFTESYNDWSDVFMHHAKNPGMASKVDSICWSVFGRLENGQAVLVADMISETDAKKGLEILQKRMGHTPTINEHELFDFLVGWLGDNPNCMPAPATDREGYEYDKFAVQLTISERDPDGGTGAMNFSTWEEMSDYVKDNDMKVDFIHWNLCAVMDGQIEPIHDFDCRTKAEECLSLVEALMK